jgi:hypothetical protein
MSRKTVLRAGIIGIILLLATGILLFFLLPTGFIFRLKDPPNLESYFFQPGELGNLAVSPVTRTISEDGVARYAQTISSGGKSYGHISVVVLLTGFADFISEPYPEDIPILNLGDQAIYSAWRKQVYNDARVYFVRCNAGVEVIIFNGTRSEAEAAAFKLDAKMQDFLCRYQTPVPR